MDRSFDKKARAGSAALPSRGKDGTLRSFNGAG
jgi:hypothetical protein